MKRLAVLLGAVLCAAAAAQSIAPEYTKWDRKQLEDAYVSKLEENAQLRRELAAVRKELDAIKAQQSKTVEAATPAVVPTEFKSIDELLDSIPKDRRPTTADVTDFQNQDIVNFGSSDWIGKSVAVTATVHAILANGKVETLTEKKIGQAKYSLLISITPPAAQTRKLKVGSTFTFVAIVRQVARHGLSTNGVRILVRGDYSEPDTAAPK